MRNDFRTVMNPYLLCADNAPASFGFYFSHCGKAVWTNISHSIAVGYLIKTIPGCNRSDFHRFK
jgi:hypothetical protein